MRTRETGTVSSSHNPFELGEAIKFGLLFGVVIFAAKAAEVHLGVDAISLSMANLAAANPASIGVAARTVIIAVLSNALGEIGLEISLNERIVNCVR